MNLFFNQKPDLKPSERRHKLEQEVRKGNNTIKAIPQDFLFFSMTISSNHFLFKLISRLKHH